MKRKNRIIIGSLIILSTIASLAFHIHAQDKPEPKSAKEIFLSYEAADQITYLEENGIPMPAAFTDNATEVIESISKGIEDGALLEGATPYNYTVLADYAQSVADFINEN